MISSVVGIAQGLIGGGARRRLQREKQAEYNNLREQYNAQDTSNLWDGMENTAEDLTVNLQAANFQAEQNQQSGANALDALNRAAGGAGIAALSRSLLNQQANNNRLASIDIGKQEQANQMATVNQASQIQNARIQGDYQQRAAQNEILTTEMGMVGKELAAANAARQQATNQLVSGIGGVAGGLVGGGILGDSEFGQMAQKAMEFGQKTV